MGRVTFTVNGQTCSVGAETDAETSLNAFLRYKLNLRGTKAMCHEGGCGACIVSVRARHPLTGELQRFAVNSCLVLVFSCHDWEVTTVEGLGNRLKGYHPIQSRLNDFYGSQCGYCSPGWVMSMYSLLDKNLTMAELEKSFGSNTCRCTGYRPILDTMKSFAVDASPDLFQRVKDIEDLHNLSTCTKTGQLCTKSCADYDEEHDWCVIGAEDKSKLEDIIEIDFPNHKFFMVTRVSDIFSILEKYRTDDYMLLAGGTGKGVLDDFKYPQLIINIQNVPELKKHEVNQNLELGGGLTLTDTMGICNEISSSQQEFAYLAQFVKHIELIAHLPVRHLGTLAGNLMLKHKMPSFQSDVFLLFETVGAYLTIKGAFNKEYEVSMTSFLETDMNGKIIYNVRLPPLSRSYKLKTYKIMPRNQNAHAIVNAGFLFELDSTNTVLKASIVYGGISAKFVHAAKTEEFLKGKYVFTNATLQGVLKVLADELNPEDILPAPSPASRKKLALGLFYKFILSICPPQLVSARLRSGGTEIERPLSRGTQDFQTDSTMFPVSQSVPKLEGLIQCSGEALYSNDVPSIPGEVYGAFVLSTIHSGTIDTIDASSVLKMNGVYAVYTAKDIPGKNSFIRPGILYENAEEEILASDKILYYGQPIAIVVCDSEALAEKVAKLLKVKYKNLSTKPPVLTTKEAIKDSNRVSQSSYTLEPKGRGTDVKKILKGTYNIHSQYHYSMEPQTCLVVPVDKSLEVYSSSQWLSLTQIVIADSLNIQESSVQLKSRRIGGGFGAKITRSCQIATACALVSKLMNLPCRFILPMQTNMASIGGRLPVLAEYEVGINGDGKIQYLELTCYENQGCSLNEGIILYQTVNGIKNCYNPDYWHVKMNDVLTDLPSNTNCRSPGNCEGIAMAEHVMEHIAFELQKDSMAVKITNMRTEDNPLPQLIEDFKKECDYDKRSESIQQFNQANRWMKKSIKIIPMSFPVIYVGNFTALVSIYQGDGTVTVSTGGIEMGQGLNTKAAQVCAYALGIPLETVSVIPTYSFVAANNAVSGSSISSESVCYSIIKACEILKTRLQPIKDQLTNPSWKEVIAKAGAAEVDLMASYMMNEKEVDLAAYSVFGITILEVLLDCLTGTFEISRVDIMEDTGLSMNNKIDVGQVEGAFIMGLGYWTSEQLINDPMTGKLKTDRSWEYKVPLALDIPVDFRVKLRYNSRNASGVLGSKAVAECPLCMAVVITHALREVIIDSRKESGYDVSKWLDIDTPYNVGNILTALAADMKEFVLS